MSSIEELIKQMQQWPSSVLLVVALAFIAWAMKQGGTIRLKIIPSLLMVGGAVLYIFIGDKGTVSPNVRNPEIILGLYGLILGVMAWIFHKFIWTQVEKKFPGLVSTEDTQFIKKPPEEKPPEVKP